MAEIPWNKRLDSTLALRADPYRFNHRECVRIGPPVFRTRLLLMPAVCMTGRDAAGRP